jgi:probable addiction module antidote protein
MAKKKEIFSRYDTADYLTNEDQIAAYLDATMEECADDPAAIAHALGVVARAQNMSRLARKTGLTREGLYKSLTRDGNPSFATVIKVAAALGLRIEFRAAPMNAG